MAERGRTKSKRSAAPWIVLVLLGLGVFAGVKSGWVGYGWAQLKSSLFPRDEALLEWVPADAMAVAIVDPHQMPLKSLPASSVLRAAFDRTRNDVKKLVGVDLAFDVDKAAVTPNLVVMRGRFDSEAIAEKLSEYRYVKADYAGRSYVVHAGEDALMVAGDDLLFYGDEAAIKGAIDAKAGVAVAKNDRVVARLARMGWDEPLVGTVQLSDDRPSVRAVLTGTTGPRAVTFDSQAGQGAPVAFDLRASGGGGFARAHAEDLAEGAGDATPRRGPMRSRRSPAPTAFPRRCWRSRRPARRSTRTAPPAPVDITARVSAGPRWTRSLRAPQKSEVLLLRRTGRSGSSSALHTIAPTNWALAGARRRSACRMRASGA